MLVLCPSGKKHNRYSKGEDVESDFSKFNAPCGLRLHLRFAMHKTRRESWRELFSLDQILFLNAHIFLVILKNKYIILDYPNVNFSTFAVFITDGFKQKSVLYIKHAFLISHVL